MFGNDELRGVALELLDAGDHGSAVDGFGAVCGRGLRGPLLEQVVEVRAGDGAGLRGGLRADAEGEHPLEAAELDGALDLGGKGVGVARALGGSL